MNKADIEIVLKHTNPMAWFDRRGASRMLGASLLRCPISSLSNKLIELGPSDTQVLDSLKLNEIDTYVGVEPFAYQETRRAIDLFIRKNPHFQGSLTLANEDGLTYLPTQQECSATVVSSMVLEHSVIGYHLPFNHTLVEQYRRELCQEIYRVTPEGGITMHSNLDEDYISCLQKVGFKQQSDRSCVFFKKV
jgi:hypothetical protein